MKGSLAGILCMCLVLSLCSGCGGRRGTDPLERSAHTRQPVLTIAWKEGLPAHRLRQLSEIYSEQAGVSIRVVQIPETIFHDGIVSLFDERNKTEFDLLLTDSYWLAGAAHKGYLEDLTSLLNEQLLFEQCPKPLKRTLSEYPAGSGTYYAAPLYPDMMVIMYRRDWYEDPENREEFKALYDRELSAPTRWVELFNQASYFKRSADYPAGAVLLTERKTHSLVLSYQALLEASGGSFGDANTYEIEGRVNSSQAKEALAMMKDLVSTGPAWAGKLGSQANALHFIHGNAAISVNWLSMAEGVLHEMGTNKVAFAALPGGESGDYAVPMLGYGISISSKAPAKNKALCRDFVRWLYSDSAQKKWQALGAPPLVLSEDTPYLNQPYGPAYRQSIEHARSFWSVVVYDQLIPVLNDKLGAAVDGELSVSRSLDELSEEWELLLREAKLLKEY